MKTQTTQQMRNAGIVCAGGTPVNGAAGGSGIVIIKYALSGPPQGTVFLLR